MMLALASLVAHDQFIGPNEAGRWQAVPVGNGLVVLRGFVDAAVLQLNARVLSEGHQIRQQKAISRFDFVLFAGGCLGVLRARGMARERESHILTTPVIPAAAPFFRAGALRLRCAAVIEEEPRIAFQCVEHRGVREDEGRAYELARPVPASFGLGSIQQHQILARFGRRMIAIGGMKIADVIRRVAIGRGANLPLDIRDRHFGAREFDSRRVEERHREVTAQMHAIRVIADDHGEGLDQILAIVAVV